MRLIYVFSFTLLIGVLHYNYIFSSDMKSGSNTENLKDTLFEKTVWHKKVSHIVLEEKQGYYHVTLLMITPHPYNYKSYNYRIYYEFSDFKQAMIKLNWLHRFLKEDGVLRVRIFGSKIISEKVLYDRNQNLRNSN